MLRERHDVAKVLTPEQEQVLLGATAEADSACHTAAVLALNTAMRKDEIRLLRWEQVDFEKPTLIVGRSKTEKGVGHLITLNVPAFEALIRWVGRFPAAKADPYVSRGANTGRLTPHALQRHGAQRGVTLSNARASIAASNICG